MRKLHIFMGTFLFFVAIVSISSPVQANTNTIPFEVSPLVDDQEGKGYFDFYITDQFSKNLYIEVRNLKNQPITVLITPINASTSSYGQISYNVNAKSNQFIDLKKPLSQFITCPKKVTIPANSKQKIPFKVELGHVENSLILGGIHFIAENEAISENEVKQGKTSFQIKNQIAYVIGMKLHTKNAAEPAFSFGKARVDLQHQEPKLFIEMKNSAPAIIKSLSGTYEVTNEDGNEVLKGSFSKMEMAPNTRFEFATDWIDGKVESGIYQVRLSAIADGKTYTSKTQFVIEDTVPVDEYNKEVNDNENDSTIPWWNYFLTAAIAGFFFLIIGKRMKRKK